MDLMKTGKLIAQLRHEKGLTQKEVAHALGVCPKTVSKWERGHGFPDVSLIGDLSVFFNVAISKLLDGEISECKTDVGNVKKTKFFVCEACGSLSTNMGCSEVYCCGRRLNSLKISENDEEHKLNIETVEDDFYITFSHSMTKEHYISFFSYVRFDRVLTIKLYPEQSGEIRFPKMRGGKLYYYCSSHGLFEANV